jgi:hypothetical protein
LFKQLYEQLAAKGLMEGMDEKQLKSKIKTFKDVYRHELAKIERSQKSGTGIEVYSPKLLWFNSAHFFREVLSTRKSQSNLVSKFTFYCIIHAIVNKMHMFHKCFRFPNLLPLPWQRIFLCKVHWVRPYFLGNTFIVIAA